MSREEERRWFSVLFVYDWLLLELLILLLWLLSMLLLLLLFIITLIIIIVYCYIQQHFYIIITHSVSTIYLEILVKACCYNEMKKKPLTDSNKHISTFVRIKDNSYIDTLFIIIIHSRLYFFIHPLIDTHKQWGRQ